jgi:hypothetical protein
MTNSPSSQLPVCLHHHTLLTTFFLSVQPSETMSTKTHTSTSVNTRRDAYALLETSLNNFETWKASILPCTDEMVGFNGKKVNLFDLSFW